VFEGRQQFELAPADVIPRYSRQALQNSCTNFFRRPIGLVGLSPVLRQLRRSEHHLACRCYCCRHRLLSFLCSVPHAILLLACRTSLPCIPRTGFPCNAACRSRSRTNCRVTFSLPCKLIPWRGGLFVYPIPIVPADTKPACARRRMRTLGLPFGFIANVGSAQRSSVSLRIPDDVELRFALSAFLHASITSNPLDDETVAATYSSSGVKSTSSGSPSHVQAVLPYPMQRPQLPRFSFDSHSEPLPTGSGSSRVGGM
jgi:hypothetical protein